MNLHDFGNSKPLHLIDSPSGGLFHKKTSAPANPEQHKRAEHRNGRPDHASTGQRQKQNTTESILPRLFLIEIMDRAHIGQSSPVNMPAGLFISQQKDPSPQPCFNSHTLCSAIQNGELIAHYQPIYSIGQKKTIGAEVLARWKHPTQGLLGPAQFIPAIKEHGLLNDLLISLIQQGLQLQEEALEHQPHQISLSFNIDPSQLYSTHLFETLEAILNKGNHSKKNINFEITEVDALTNLDVATENLHRLKSMGVRLSMDDFGAGHSSLQRLITLPFDTVKLDSFFVRTSHENPHSRKVIANAIFLAKSMGLAMVIEGVETEAQKEEVVRLGGDLIQGYWYARPMSKAAFLKHISR